jgi:ribosome-binding factor A
VASRKQAQIEEALKREVSKIALFELADPGVGFLSVTRVRLARDQRSARVNVVVRGDEETVQNTLSALRRARGNIQERIAKRLPLRWVPVLDFVLDEEYARFQKIEKAVREAREPEAPDAPLGDLLDDI